MARQWLKETLIRITEITISGRKINAATAYRWKNKGVRGHKLETTWAGGCCTSVEAVADFVAKMNAAHAGGQQPSQMTGSQRKRQAANASEQLAKAGL